MAGIKPLLISGDIVNELDCPICMEQKTLHLLPCAHRCCLACIRNIAGDNKIVSCPICRKETAFPGDGFPVCPLSDYLRDQVNIASSVNEEKAAGREVDRRPRCDTCNGRSEVDAQCRQCLSFLCYRCAVATRCSSMTGKHIADDLNSVIAKSNVKFDMWRHQAKSEITSLQKIIEQSQRELNEKLAKLKASEQIDTKADTIQRLNLIKQLCAVSNQPASPPANQTAKVHHSPAILNVPRHKLQFDSEYDTGYHCCTVEHCGPSILIGCLDGGLLMFDRNLKSVRSQRQAGNIMAAQYDGQVFLSDMTPDKASIQHHQSKLFQSEMLFTFERKSKINNLAASQTFIAVLDRDHNMAKLYCRNLKRTLTISFPGMKVLHNLKFTSSRRILVSGVSIEGANTLTKYQLEWGHGLQIMQMWSVTEKDEVCGIAQNSSGQIYLAGLLNKTIHVYSADGVKKRELRSEKLPHHIEDISIQHDELAVAGWNTNKLLLFKIK